MPLSAARRGHLVFSALFSSIMGRESVVAITKGKLDFGLWEQIFYGEFDGHRPKRVLVKIIGERSAPEGRIMDVQKGWTRLLSVQELTFEARSRAASNTGWNGTGKGMVRVETVESGVMLFYERGAWTPMEGRPTTFTNVFRWTADPDGQFIRLEHLRFGQDHPVYLFDLVAVDEGVLASSEPHVCREDLYAARMEFDEQTVYLSWTINGPRKAETITYTYR